MVNANWMASMLWSVTIVVTVIVIIIVVIINVVVLLQVDAWCCSCAIHSSICWAAFSARVTQVRKPPKFAV